MVRDDTSLSKNHNSNGPVIISIPSAIIIIPEYLGSIARIAFDFCVPLILASVGNNTKPKKITPPIHTDANKLCT